MPPYLNLEGWYTCKFFQSFVTPFPTEVVDLSQPVMMLTILVYFF